MKSCRRELTLEVPARRASIDITGDVEQAVGESGRREGLFRVTPMHITASVFINDPPAGLREDYERWLERLAAHVPVDQSRHYRTGEDTADAHLRRHLMGRSGGLGRSPPII